MMFMQKSRFPYLHDFISIKKKREKKKKTKTCISVTFEDPVPYPEKIISTRP